VATRRRSPAHIGRAQQHAKLPTPVPIYVTYLTAHATDGQVAFVDDIYGRDTQPVRVSQASFSTN